MKIKEKNPLTLWIIVGICFFIVVITWLPITFQRMSDMTNSLFEQTKTGSQEAKNIWETQGKQEINQIMNQISEFASSTPTNQADISEFSQNLKDQLLQNASSSATTSLAQ